MSIDPVSAVGTVLSDGPLARAQSSASAPADFARWMGEQLSDVNEQIAVAERALTQLAAGEGNLHQVMLDLEKARTAFQLTVQVRNKLIEGYQELMRMQV